MTKTFRDWNERMGIKTKVKPNTMQRSIQVFIKLKILDAAIIKYRYLQKYKFIYN